MLLQALLSPRWLSSSLPTTLARTMRTLALMGLAVCAAFWPQATGAQDCSKDSTTATTILFINNSDSAVDLYWINQQCIEVRYANIEPGKEFLQQTFATHPWRLRHTGNESLLREVTATAAPMTVRLVPLTTALPRALEDRADDVTGYQVHVMYVLPSGGVDNALDTKGVIAQSVAAMQAWFVGQTRGPRLRLDTLDGALDITFARLRRSQAELFGFGVNIRDRIEEELRERGYIQPRKIYAVYYDGNAVVCGSGPWPPDLIGSVAAMYLRGTPKGARPCAENPFAARTATPGYWEYSLAHEILHTIGVVAECAPHHHEGGHVSDSPQDLMYRGPRDWVPSILDVGRDDYYGHGNLGCLDLARSVFLDPLPVAIPPGWPR